jgi:hypothetical protein
MNTIVKKIPTAARILSGLIFTVFGLNGFLHFLPQPPMQPGPALSFVMGLLGTGYFIPLLKGTEVLSGLLLLSNRFVPLALTLLAPIVVNIFAFHAFLAPSGVPLAVVVVALEIYLAWTYRASFAPMLHARTEASAPVEGRAVSASPTTPLAGMSSASR